MADSHHQDKANLSSRNERSLLFLILGAAFVLRINQIESQGFWVDEAGQVMAALNPSFSGMIKTINSHAMAMPMDYFVTRLTSHFSLSETVLRLPSAIWGTLAILFFYLFVKTFFQGASNKTNLALTASAIFAITPLQIYYAQEVRFYAALTFFFWFISWSVIRLLMSQGLKELMILVVSSLIGVYFHPYVLLAYLLGGFIVLFAKTLDIKDFSGHHIRLLSKSTLLMILSGLMTVGAFGLWFVFSNPKTQFNYELMRFSEEWFSPWFGALGWTPRNICISTQRGIWEYFLIISTIISVVIMFFRRELAKKMILLVGFFLIGSFAILGLTALRGYWITFRQFIHIAPISYVLVALFLDEIGNWILKELQIKLNLQNTPLLCNVIVRSLLIVIVFIIAFPRINYYYKTGRGNGREIAEKLASLPIDEYILVVEPYYESTVYAFYSRYYQQDQSIQLANLSQLEELKGGLESGNVYFALPYNLTDLPFDEADYQPLVKSTYSCSIDRVLWVKKGN